MSDVRRTRRLLVGIAGAVTGLVAAAAAVPQPGATAVDEGPPWFGGRLLVLRDGDGNHHQLWDPGTLETTPWRWQEGFGIGEFSHDGALFVRPTDQRELELRHPDGTVEPLGRLPARQPELDHLTADLNILHEGFAAASDTVVALAAADGTGEHYHQHPYIWRLEAGEEPTRVAYLGDYVESHVFWATDPRSPYVYYSEPGDDGLGRVDVTTGVVEHLLDTGLVPIAIDPASDRVLLSSRSGGVLSWYDVAGETLTPWFDGPIESDVVYEAAVTPDGTAVTLEAWSEPMVEFRALSDAALLHAYTPSWDAPGPAFTYGWQPCPAEACTSYVADERPPAVPDVEARSGRPGAPSTVRVSWTKLPDLLGGVTQYWVKAVRWRDGERVGVEVFSYRHWIGHAAPALTKGNYTVQVRARNYVGYGPWSDPSDVVRAR